MTCLLAFRSDGHAWPRIRRLDWRHLAWWLLALVAAPATDASALPRPRGKKYATFGTAGQGYRMAGVQAPLVVLAAHPDDAALFMGATIADAVSSGRRVLVVTFATGSPPAGHKLTPYAHEEVRSWGQSIDRAMAVRRGEDDSAMYFLGADYVHAGALDAIFRLSTATGEPLYPTKGLVARGPPAGNDDPLRAVVVDAVSKLLRIPGSQFFLPLAVNHVDHMVLRDAALGELEGTGRRVGLYEDSLDAMRDPSVLTTHWAGFLTGHLWDRRPIAVSPRATATKVAAVLAHASQIDNLFGVGADEAAVRELLVTGAERVANATEPSPAGFERVRIVDAALAEGIWVPRSAAP